MFKQTRTAVFLVVLLLPIWAFSLPSAAKDKPELYLESNVLAAGNYNEGTSSSDISLIIRIDAGDDTVVDEGATVRYIVPQKNIEGWTEVDFDDSSWDVGAPT